MLDYALPHLVVQPQEGADDEARDDDDGRAADHGLLIRPFDLLELGVGLLEEADAGDARPNVVAALAARLGGLSLRLVLCRRTRLGRRPEWRCPRRLSAPLPALLSCRARHRLAGLPMQCVAAAPAAVLAELDAVGRVSLRLLRLIVPPPALGTGERDCDSDSGCHSCFSFRGTRSSSAGWARTTDLCIMSAAL